MRTTINMKSKEHLPHRPRALCGVHTAVAYPSLEEFVVLKRPGVDLVVPPTEYRILLPGVDGYVALNEEEARELFEALGRLLPSGDPAVQGFYGPAYMNTAVKGDPGPIETWPDPSDS
jgi:hypothetical protein